MFQPDGPEMIAGSRKDSGFANRAWRLIGTGFSFSLFGVAGLVMGLIVFPLLFIFLREPARRQRVARGLIALSFGAFIRIMSAIGVLSYRIDGLAEAKETRNCLIIANHPTLIDVVFLIWLFPQSDCVIKEAVVRNPFMRSVVLAANYISNDDPLALLTTCVERLRAGSSLILFPEGTRSVQGQSLALKLGAAAAAVRSDSLIQPVLISCTPPTLAKNEPWHQIPRQQPFFHLRIFAPRSVRDFVPTGSDERQRTRTLNQAFADFFEGKSGGIEAKEGGVWSQNS
jgi:1-acyl-sn-glycerol-3-phosphate acyltransferase